MASIPMLRLKSREQTIQVNVFVISTTKFRLLHSPTFLKGEVAFGNLIPIILSSL